MNTGTIIAIALGAGIPCVLILIGIIGLLIKFFMKRCRARAWENINSLPKHFDSTETGTTRRLSRSLSSECEPLFPTTTVNNNVLEVTDGPMSTSIDESDIPPSERTVDHANQHGHTLVQIQRDRLNKLRDDELHSRPTLTVNIGGENEIKQAIDLAQKEFEDSVANASMKLKRRQED